MVRQLALLIIVIAGVAFRVESWHHGDQVHSVTSTPESARMSTMGVDRHSLPNAHLTPGAALPVTLADLCRPGYTRVVRRVAIDTKRDVYREYGVPYRRNAAEIDHLIALELGGSNAIANLWPEPYGIVWNAHVKDHEENRLHEFVCSGRMSLAAAQHDIATNWIAAYQRDIAPEPQGETAAYEK